MPHHRRDVLSTICSPTGFEIALGTGVRDLHYILILPHYPDTLHAYDHVPQNMTMEHLTLPVSAEVLLAKMVKITYSGILYS